MIIDSVKLANFRCHEVYELKCTEETSLILGKNGCGKTSVLEAILIALNGKSFRAVDREILKRGTEYYRVEVKYINGAETVVVYDGDKKTFLVEDKKFNRLPKKNRYPVVLFEPSDLNLIEASPGRRRDYFDRWFMQLEDEYGRAVSRYTKALRQRNELLKKEILKRDELFSWNVMIARYGTEIFVWRKKMVEKINESLNDVYHSIADNDDVIEIKYVSEADKDESEYLKKLEGDFVRDKMLGYTGFGIHRDDYEFLFNTVPASGSASRGEMRTIALALKFIEAKMLVEKIGKAPVILLDDVFSELDETRQKALIKNFKDNQVILTSVEGVKL